MVSSVQSILNFVCSTQVGPADEYLRDELIVLEDMQRAYCEAEDYVNAYVVRRGIIFFPLLSLGKFLI